MKNFLLLTLIFFSLSVNAEYCAYRGSSSQVKQIVSYDLAIITTSALAKYNDDDRNGPTHLAEEFDLMPYPAKKVISIICSKNSAKDRAFEKCEELGGVLGENLESKTICPSHQNILTAIVNTFDDWVPVCDSIREDECLGTRT